jgi:hypothetical protein
MDSLKVLDNIDVRFKSIYYIFNISLLLAFVGVFIKMAFASLKIGNEQGPGFATAIGYIVSFISLFTLLIAVISYYLKSNGKCFSLYPSFFQIIALLIIFFVIIRQSLAYSTMINERKVDQEYYKFSGYSSVLIIFQIILIFSYLRGNMACMTSVTNPVADPSIGTLYLSVTLFVLNGLCVGIMEVILRLFSTCF